MHTRQKSDHTNLKSILTNLKSTFKNLKRGLTNIKNILFPPAASCPFLNIIRKLNRLHTTFWLYSKGFNYVVFIEPEMLNKEGIFSSFLEIV